MSIRWLKFWVGLGAVALIASIVMPPLLLWNASKDIARYRECLEGRRTDCERTMVWNLVDAAAILERQGGSSTGAFGIDLSEAVENIALRTSESAPFIEKVEPVGMSNVNGTYSAKSGAEVRIKATVTGRITSVELFEVENEDGRPVKAGTFSKQADGTWALTHKLSPGFIGKWEVRAYGDDPKDLAALGLTVAAN